MIVLPKQPNSITPPIWDQQNNTDVNGSLWASFGLDLSENEGKMRLGKRILLNTSTADVAEITSYPVAFAQIGGRKLTIAGASGTGYVFSINTTYPSAGPYAKVTDSNSPTTVDSLYSDMIVSNGFLYVSTASNTVNYSSDGSTWSSPLTVGASDTTSTHMMTSYANRTYMTKSQSNVISWDSSNSIATLGNTYTLQIPDANSNTITFLRSASNRIWIGTVNANGGKGYVHEWDGASQQVTKSYRLETSGALACVIKDDVPWIMDTLGQLSVWNGGTFIKKAKFNRRRNRLLFNVTDTVNDRYIHPNGMSLINGKINMLIKGQNSDATSTNDETIPSGIWEYDEVRGLIHKYGISITKSDGTISDFGAAKLSGAGALSEANVPSNSSSRNGTFLVGASFFTDATTISSGIFYDDSNDTLQKAGSFITTKQYAQNSKGGVSIQNTWQNLYTLYKQLLTSTDKITVKYRISEQEPVETTITWASTTTFTVPNSSLVVSNYWTSGIGGEVDILNGVGAGKCSHITNASLNAGTWTVTLDEIYTGATGTAIARFQSWIKYPVPILYNNSIVDGVTFDQEGIGKLSNWIQLKVWMLFTGRDELEKLVIINDDTNPAH